MSKRDNLTKNQEIVFDLLQKSKEPLGAYSILFNTEKNGIKAPLQVYRALDKLIENGKVHRIESKNSYVACTNSDCNITKSTSFLICEKCDKVSEINKLKKELDYNNGFLKSVENKLKNENFVNNAPDVVVEKEKQKIKDAKQKIESIKKSISELS